MVLAPRLEFGKMETSSNKKSLPELAALEGSGSI